MCYHSRQDKIPADLYEAILKEYEIMKKSPQVPELCEPVIDG